MSNSLWPHQWYSPWNSPGRNTGVGTLSLLQGIFPTQGSNPGLPHCRQIIYLLRNKGSPRILEWVAYPFSQRSSWPRSWTRVSCIAGGFFSNWALREAHLVIQQETSAAPSSCRRQGMDATLEPLEGTSWFGAGEIYFRLLPEDKCSC